MAVAVSTEAEIELFLETLRLDAGISDFIANLGQDLVASGVLREAEFGKQPSRLQRSKLKSKFKESKIYVGDIDTGEEWQTKPDDWWDLHGAKLVLRIQGA